MPCQQMQPKKLLLSLLTASWLHLLAACSIDLLLLHAENWVGDSNDTTDYRVAGYQNLGQRGHDHGYGHDQQVNMLPVTRLH